MASQAEKNAVEAVIDESANKTSAVTLAVTEKPTAETATANEVLDEKAASVQAETSKIASKTVFDNKNVSVDSVEKMTESEKSS